MPFIHRSYQNITGKRQPICSDVPIMTRRKIQTITHSVEETRLLGKKIGTWLDKGTVIALTGDLGSGKTVFVQGLAKGLAVPEGYYITSPTFTLINEYPARYPLFHIDLYRIGDPIELEDTGIFEILHGDGVVAIEWADRLDEDVLSDHLAVHFEITNDETRKITMTSYGHSAFILLEKLGQII
jgi:tRNA threonylcarbamoyladenosine biosynthesis protein TsaE